jgi:hypothetical protein
MQKYLVLYGDRGGNFSSLFEELDWVADQPADVERKGRLPLFLNCVTKATYSGWIGLTRA